MFKRTIVIGFALTALVVTAACEKVIVDPDISTGAVNPQPADGATGIPIMTELSWEIKGDPIDYKFDVFFGDTTPPPLVREDYFGTAYNVGYLRYDSTFYWQIVTHDRLGGTVEGPIWSFTTWNGYFIDEGFEGDFPPEGWAADPEWTQSDDSYTGDYSAECYLEYPGSGTVSAELTTPWFDKNLVTYDKMYLKYPMKYDLGGGGGIILIIYIEGGDEPIRMSLSGAKNGWEISSWQFPPPYQGDYFRLKFVCEIQYGGEGNYVHLWLDDIRLTDFIQLPGLAE